jgi:anaerobic selenocysteine-containing dehydrogenase
MQHSWIEKWAEKLGLIPAIASRTEFTIELEGVDSLDRYPEPREWDDFVTWDPRAWPERKERHYTIVPTTCFNCEAACGLLAYIDKETNRVHKFEGNPYHPSSRGRTCAKGPATINQINDPERIHYPLKRKGERGAGQWERISWDQALDEIATKIRQALRAGRRDKVVYHVGRPGHEGYAERVLKAWGVDGHNSHTNICSAGARFGYGLWHKYDRPSPDYARAKVIVLASSHLETGHYFNPHAQRILEGVQNGAKLVVLDPRLSNTASMADYWLPTYPGSEPAVFLAMAKIILDEELYDREYLETWVNWDDYLRARHPDAPVEFELFIDKIREEYARFTPEFAAREAGISAKDIVEVAHVIASAGSRLATHVWRGASIGNLGGWQVSRTLHFLNVLTGSVGTPGGTSPSGWNKFHPKLFDVPPPPPNWNELHFPPEYTLCHYEMSPILPHLIKDGRGTIDVYFTRVFNPVWTYPDGFSWIEVLSDPEKIGCHVALTPTWNETAFFADYVLPMGHASERHDLNSYETYSGIWIAFRQPVLREKARREGREFRFTYEVNPGEVWEEDEFWIELSWRIDQDEDLGIRRHFLSPYRPGEKITIDEYYQYIFENTPGLPEKAAEEGLSPLEYMRRYGAFEVQTGIYEKNRSMLDSDELEGASIPEKGTIIKDGQAIGLRVGGRNLVGYPTPSRKQEFFSQTMVDFGYPEYAIPGYIRSHVHRENLDPAKNEFVLLPNFRLPTHIHSRSANAKWLAEIAHRNPIWIHTSDAEKLGVTTGDLLKVTTEIGWFVDKVWVTEAIKPGVVACSHHIGRWRREQDAGNRWMTNTVKITRVGDGQWTMETVSGVQPWTSEDPDSRRIWWREGGVHQNITHAPQPDPISGAHCWLQKVRLSKPAPGEKYGDVFVDTNKSFQYFKQWNQWAKDRETHPDGLRRPLWMNRTLAPQKDQFYIKRQSEED